MQERRLVLKRRRRHLRMLQERNRILELLLFAAACHPALQTVWRALLFALRGISLPRRRARRRTRPKCDAMKQPVRRTAEASARGSAFSENVLHRRRTLNFYIYQLGSGTCWAAGFIVDPIRAIRPKQELSTSRNGRMSTGVFKSESSLE